MILQTFNSTILRELKPLIVCMLNMTVKCPCCEPRTEFIKRKHDRKLMEISRKHDDPFKKFVTIMPLGWLDLLSERQS